MAMAQKRLGGPEWLILSGASSFILVRGVSAWWQADIRWLHFCIHTCREETWTTFA
jgi:hypothetical protein